MTSIPTGVAWRLYLRALAEAGLDVASVGAWIAAAELPPARRRIARGALAAVTVAVAIPGVRAIRADVAGTAESVIPGARSGLPFVDAGIRIPAGEPAGGDASARRQAVLAGAVVLATAGAVSVGVAAAGRRLERRWLARLARHGHPHPHRALGVRMAALYAVVVVPSRLLAVRKAAEADRRENVPGGADAATGTG
ncbi:hypothetical protein SAMN05443287_101533 [Micromonospora phaseoli]|uniref:Uncharacterized protein n=1 Tax=Micromonospora phaseoli TaxID=1144548 RepID=A0A1H6S8Y2_9ACTN|nr:hypothetical protein [Micromonospora phaseoli]PZW03782.1 hypothetical protein CLV64_101533 [Micromonospora phaseoli]GIJ79079.1 hypothetical protein Xph01_35110 [Micromonospora phaseoli]SEI62364.1 hypothetical protein SAMN05443287_101533 [Micromonospora phaseoli]